MTASFRLAPHRTATSSPVRLLPLLAVCTSLGWLFGCESTDGGGDTDEAGNILLGDENNYESESQLTIPTVETAASDLDICWPDVVSDIQCHDVDPVGDLDNVALLRFRNLTESQIEDKLASGELPQSEVDGYLEFHTDHENTCTKLSELSFLGTPIKLEEEYVESDDAKYLLLLAKGKTPGVGARSMTFLKPTSSSQNTRVDALAGCGTLEFTADLGSAKELSVPMKGPWVVDWRNVSRDGQGNDVIFENITSVLLGFYEGMTVTDLEENILDIELIATTLWEIPLKGGRTADLAAAKERGGTARFKGFETDKDGTWLLGLMCNNCQNPAPVVLSILKPTGAE